MGDSRQRVSVCSLKLTACFETLEFTPQQWVVVGPSHSGPQMTLGL